MMTFRGREKMAFGLGYVRRWTCYSRILRIAFYYGGSRAGGWAAAWSVELQMSKNRRKWHFKKAFSNSPWIREHTRVYTTVRDDVGQTQYLITTGPAPGNLLMGITLWKHPALFLLHSLFFLQFRAVFH